MGWSPRTTFAAWLAACVAMCATAWGQSTHPASAPSANVLGLVTQLGDKRWTVRQAAHHKLLTMRDPGVVPALRQAAASNDLEAALRAKALLAELLNFSHVVRDGLGEPIADATVTLAWPEPEDSPQTVTLTTNMFGGATLPPVVDRPQGQIQLYHKRYGVARGGEPGGSSRDEDDGDLPPAPIFVPLVAKDSPAYERALRGQVVGPDGKGVPGAEVACHSVRTHDGEFDLPDNALDVVLTDSEGRFAFYMPDPSPERSRGLIPLHSQYQAVVRAAGLFPCLGDYDNAAPVVIRLPRPERFHRFEFETDDGGRVSGSNMDHVSLVFHPTSDKILPLDSAYIRDGGKLMPGRYSLEGSNAEYLPLDVTKDSPELLLFRRPPPMTFRGRVVDGVTGKPMPGAFVIAHSDECCGKPLELTDADWTALEALPVGATKNALALNALRKLHPFGTLGRTDEQGRYELVDPDNAKSAHLMAFARNRLPYSLENPASGRDRDNMAPMGDLFLFPAARVTFQAVSPKDVSVTPAWEFASDDQPEWLWRYKTVAQRPRNEAKIACIHQLPANAPHTIYVPAGLRLTLVLQPVHDDQFSLLRFDKPIQLPPGGSLDVGKLALELAPAVTVRVTGPDGKPLQGVPVQQLYIPENIWLSTRVTDAEGLATFNVERHSRGYFSLPNPVRTAFVRAHAGSATVPFQIDAIPPTTPLSLPLTAPQAHPYLPRTAPAVSE